MRAPTKAPKAPLPMSNIQKGMHYYFAYLNLQVVKYDFTFCKIYCKHINTSDCLICWVGGILQKRLAASIDVKINPVDFYINGE